MVELQTSNKIAVAFSQSYSRAHHLHRTMYCFPDSANIRSYLVILKMRETSIHSTEWNGLIQSISEAGLISKWSRSTTRRSNNIETREGGTINMNHFIGVIFFVSCGYFLALIVAICEQIIHYKAKQQRNHHRCWNAAHMLIDGQRHMFILNENTRM